MVSVLRMPRFAPTVGMILNVGCLGESEVVAGDKGLNRPVSGVTVMTTPDPYDWLKPGELLLTTGYTFPSGQDEICEAVRRFIDIGISGLAYKEGRYMPCLAKETLQLADTCSFPILRLPSDTTWTRIFDSTYRFLLSEAPPAQFTSRERPDQEVMTDFVSFLLDNLDLPCESIEKLATDLEIKANPNYSLFLIRQPSIAELIKSAQFLRSATLMESKNCIPIIKHGYLAVVWPSTCNSNSRSILDESNFLESVFRKHGLESAAQMAVPYHATAPEDLAQSFIMAKKVLSLHNWDSNKQFIVRYDPFMLQNNIIDFMDKNALSNFCASTIGALIEHDAQNDTELLKTLEIYLTYDCSVAKTSEQLFIHPSTVKHRVKRASEILGLNSMTFQQKSQIFLAINIVKMLLPSQGTDTGKQQFLSEN